MNTHTHTHLVVETENGLRIVRSTQKNFFNSNYCVQFVGTEEECKTEMKRLKNLVY